MVEEDIEEASASSWSGSGSFGWSDGVSDCVDASEANDVELADGEFSLGSTQLIGSSGSCACLCCDLNVFLILSSVKGVRLSCPGCGCGTGLLYSCTVLLMAVVISSRLVYGKQTFNTVLSLCAVMLHARSIDSRTSGLIKLLCPNILMLAPYLSSSSPCCDSCVSLILAISISASTSYFDRLKFSMLKA